LQKIITQWNRLTTKQKKTLIIVLIVFVVGVFYLSVKSNQVPEQQLSSEQGVPVVVTAVKERVFERFVAVQGNLESKNFAVVSPRVGGTIEKIFIDEGEPVVANQSKLFKTDAVRLEEALQVQKHLLAVADSARRQAVANLEKTKADFQKAELDYQRFARLFERKAVTADAFERQQSRYKQLKAAVELARAGVDLTTEEVSKAKAELAISEKDLADTVVYAPISGKVSYRFKEPGEMGQPGEPVVRIDDTSLIEVSAYLSSQYYPQVIQGQTKMEVVVSGEALGQLPISYKSPTINPKLRTFEVKCILDNPSGAVAAGAMAEVRVILERKEGLAVPSASIQKRSNKSVVFAIRDNKAHKVEVKEGIENDGWTEVISDGLNEQILVVTMGQDMLDEGKPVSVQKEEIE